MHVAANRGGAAGSGIMIRHVFRIAWNRRRANVLIAVEVFLAFLVVTVIAVMGVFFLDNYAQPLGFDFRDVWAVRIDMNAVDSDASRADQVPFEQTPAWQRTRIATLARLVGDLPEVLDVWQATHALYDAGSGRRASR
jgi:putative ABC transport system permease protein